MVLYSSTQESVKDINSDRAVLEALCVTRDGCAPVLRNLSPSMNWRCVFS